MPWWKIILIALAVKITLLLLIIVFLAQKEVPAEITYGMSFNTMYATELDYQIAEAERVGAEVVLAVGRRLPRWPECHIPEWASKLDVVNNNTAQLEYVTQVVERYRNSPAIKIWQVENEPFLEVFAFDHCGFLDTDFLDKEIALVR